jgi:hypothetical protein
MVPRNKRPLTLGLDARLLDDDFPCSLPNNSLLPEKTSLFHCLGNWLQAIEFARRLDAEIAEEGRN